MGQIIAKYFPSIFKDKEAKIVLVGLDAAGKTSLLYKIKLNEDVVTIPTIGFNVEAIKYHNVVFTMWDIGGQDKIRPLWRHYYDHTGAVIFVVDSNDPSRFAEAREELHKMLSDPRLERSALLVYANKQDLPNASSVTEVAEKLDLKGLKNINWFIQPCCAVTGEGIYEGLDWISHNLPSTSS